MSSTSQYTTFEDLYVALQRRIRQQTSIADTEMIAKQYVNSAHQDIYIGHGEKFAWAERRDTITTHAVYSTGTVTATKGSATITGASTAWDTDNGLGQNNMRVGGKITIAGSQTVYRVTGVATDTSATIDPSYISDTESGLSYQYFEDEYALADDFAKPIDHQTFDEASDGMHSGGRGIPLLGRQDFRRIFPRNRIPAQYIRAAVILDLPFDGDTTPVRKVRFAPPPINTQVIPYAYVTKNIAVSAAGAEQQEMSADEDEPIMPLRHRHLILARALVSAYERKDDLARSQTAFAEYQELLRRVIGDQDIGQQRMSIRVRTAGYKRRAASPYRRGTGRRFDLYGRFDRLED